MNMLLLVFLALLHLTSAKVPSNAILLSNVKSLTLRGDQLTAARRVKAIPQLKCIGGNGKGLYDVDVMRCRNTGSEYDAEDISWTCQASLPPEFKLGSTEVICEGYASADDPYVLKGSCGVEYRLALTELGESKYGNRKTRSFRSTAKDEDSPSMIFTALFWLVFLGIIGFFIYKIFIEGTGTDRRINDGFHRYYGGGGGGPGDDNDPPPPYSRRPPRPAAKKTQPSQQAWRPGFWSGAAAGAAAGYAMGNRGNTRTQNAPAQAGPSNWFNTGARTTTPSNTGWGAQSSDSGPSNSRYESTGFGGTRRR